VSDDEPYAGEHQQAWADKPSPETGSCPSTTAPTTSSMSEPLSRKGQSVATETTPHKIAKIHAPALGLPRAPSHRPSGATAAPASTAP
jgi:hypothetical protein